MPKSLKLQGQIYALIWLQNCPTGEKQLNNQKHCNRSDVKSHPQYIGYEISVPIMGLVCGL